MSRCAYCGVFVQEHQADLTADGLRCAACSQRASLIVHEQAMLDRERDKQLMKATRHRRGISALHATLWMGAISDLPISGWLAAPLALGALGLAIALAWRKPNAWKAALVLDVTLAALLVTMAPLGMLVAWVLLTTLAIDLVWKRQAFADDPPAQQLALAPLEAWKTPGRQL